MEIEFVTFYADGGARQPTIKGDLDGISQINLLIKSAQRFHSEANFTVLTDELTDMTELPSNVLVKRHKVNLSNIMLERTRVQAEHLESPDFHCPIIFTDTDVLICSNIEAVFDEDFDIGFTWRKSEEMPINGGVIYVNFRSPEISRQVFNNVFKSYSLKYGSAAAWYGDQFAIMNLVNLGFSEIYKSPTIDRFGAKIRLFPCEEYNFSPKENKPNLRFNKNAKIYHFKGMSRRLMKLFWELHLNSQGMPKVMRSLKLIYHDIRLKLQRRSYRSKLRRDIKRFNCGEQNNAAWVDRAEIAARFVAKVVQPDQIVSLADVGCGDAKLKSILANENLQYHYCGYDLVPQGEDVQKFNIDSDTLPACDIAVVLGVLEYSHDITKPLRMLARSASFLVVSHAVSDYRKMTPSSLKRLNWKTHLSAQEFSRALEQCGFVVVESQVTSNQKSIVWLCRKA